MNLTLDHIVHFIKDNPSKAVDELQRQGFKAVVGGSHEQWGSYNSLLYLHSSYIEFLAVEEESIAARSNNPLISQLVSDLSDGEGIGQLCFRTDAIEELSKSFQTKGFEPLPIFNGSRKRKDGVTIHWKMLFLKNTGDVPFPFFIQWEQDDECRYAEFKEQGLLDEKLLETKVDSLYFAVENKQVPTEAWAKLFNVAVEIDSNEARIRVGELNIIFKEPSEGNTLVADTLSNRRECPFAVKLHPPLNNGELHLFGSFYC
ncbi:VOC family protein [Cytobacillus purgationiresistens]|nr:VOC family protein [Cytobacillus purgationiresistens]